MMKITKKMTVLAFAAVMICQTGFGAPKLYKITPPGHPPVRKQRVQAASEGFANECELLRRAYVLLSLADHDYDGHRLRALQLTAHAAVHLGGAFGGDGSAGENQNASDAKLRQARAILGTVHNDLLLRSRPRVARIVDAALAQINLALKAA